MKDLNSKLKISINRIINIAGLLVLIIGIISYIFRSNIGTFFFSIKYKSPVEWNNIKIEFPEKIVYKVSDNSIMFFNWEEPINFLSVRKVDLNQVQKDYLLNFLGKKGFKTLKSEDLSFRKLKSFSISYIDTDHDSNFNKNIYIIPKNVGILYSGNAENYSDFHTVINSIEFLK